MVVCEAGQQVGREGQGSQHRISSKYLGRQDTEKEGSGRNTDGKLWRLNVALGIPGKESMNLNCNEEGKSYQSVGGKPEAAGLAVGHWVGHTPDLQAGRQ